MQFYDLKVGSLFSDPADDARIAKVRDLIRKDIIPDEVAADIWHIVSAGTDVTVYGHVAEYGNVQLPFLVVPVHNYPSKCNYVRYFVVYRDRIVETGTCTPTEVCTKQKFYQFIRKNLCAKYGQMPDHTAKTLWDLFGWFGTIL